MTLNQVIEQLRDGKSYRFMHPNLQGYFYKAPFPADDEQTSWDGACSAITYWIGDKPASPVMLLDDFDRDDWTMQRAPWHPVIARKR